MNAILLSAGIGERLRPLTNTIPKVMVPLSNKPLLQYWVELLNKHGINNIAINTHHFGKKIEDYFGDGKNLGVNIRYSRESSLLGTATPIKMIEQLYPGFCSRESFFVIYADNLSNIDLTKVKNYHINHKSLATLTLFHHDELWTRGIVQTNKEGKVLGFFEKPAKKDILSGKIKGEPASCVMILEPEILKYLKEEKEDLGVDLFPRLLNVGEVMYAFNPGGYVQDVGTIERYEQAKKDVLEFPEKFDFKN